MNCSVKCFRNKLTRKKKTEKKKKNKNKNPDAELNTKVALRRFIKDLKMKGKTSQKEMQKKLGRTS